MIFSFLEYIKVLILKSVIVERYVCIALFNKYTHLLISILVLSSSIHAFFIIVSIYIFILHIFSETRVTFDTIQGGISIYLLIGVFWH